MQGPHAPLGGVGAASPPLTGRHRTAFPYCLPFDCDPQCTCTVTFRSPNLNQFLRDTVSVLPLQLHPLKGASDSNTPTAETTLQPCPERTRATQIRVPPGMPPSGNRSEGGSHPPYPAWQPAECTRGGVPSFSFATGLGRGVCSSSSSPLSEPPSGASATRGHSTGTTAGTLPPVRRSTWWLKTSGRCTKRLDGSHHREPTL